MKSVKRPSITAPETTTPTDNEKPAKPANVVKLSDLADTSELVRLNLSITKAERTKLKAYAMQQDKTMTEVITSFINTLDQR